MINSLCILFTFKFDDWELSFWLNDSDKFSLSLFLSEVNKFKVYSGGTFLIKSYSIIELLLL